MHDGDASRWVDDPEGLWDALLAASERVKELIARDGYAPIVQYTVTATTGAQTGDETSVQGMRNWLRRHAYSPRTAEMTALSGDGSDSIGFYGTASVQGWVQGRWANVLSEDLRVEVTGADRTTVDAYRDNLRSLLRDVGLPEKPPMDLSGLELVKESGPKPLLSALTHNPLVVGVVVGSLGIIGSVITAVVTYRLTSGN